MTWERYIVRRASGGWVVIAVTTQEVVANFGISGGARELARLDAEARNREAEARNGEEAESRG